MKIEHFRMERMQSTWENVVDYNLSESGVHPLSLEELVSKEELEEIVRIGLGYSQTNGTPELRQRIAGLYPGISIEQILATAGSSEANFLLMWSLIEPGDEVVFMMPNYMQMWGLVRGFGAKLKPFWLRESLGWAPDLDELRKVVTKKTKLIILTNPNNPTGAVLSQEVMETIINLAIKPEPGSLQTKSIRELSGMASEPRAFSEDTGGLSWSMAYPRPTVSLGSGSAGSSRPKSSLKKHGPSMITRRSRPAYSVTASHGLLWHHKTGEKSWRGRAAF